MSARTGSDRGWRSSHSTEQVPGSSAQEGTKQTAVHVSGFIVLSLQPKPWHGACRMRSSAAYFLLRVCPLHLTSQDNPHV
jgi:hypothetical protein